MCENEDEKKILLRVSNIHFGWGDEPYRLTFARTPCRPYFLISVLFQEDD